MNKPTDPMSLTVMSRNLIKMRAKKARRNENKQYYSTCE